MPELSENEIVVTPNGNVGKYIGRNAKGVKVKCEYHRDHHSSFDLVDNVVKVSEPIRVRVSNEAEAECLVEVAEANGFNSRFNIEIDQVDFEQYRREADGIALRFVPDKKEWLFCDTEIVVKNHDLTFESDYAQIKGWIEAHSESEDECYRCDGSGEVTDYSMSADTLKPCPQCTDDSEPRDDEGLDGPKEIELADQIYNAITSAKPRIAQEYAEELTHSIIDNLDYIDDLESELSDCWENQQEYKNDVAELHRKVAFWKGECSNRESIIEELQNERAELEERIEEARELLDWGYTQYPVKAVLDGEDWKEWVNEENYEDIEKTIKENRDSDED